MGNIKGNFRNIESLLINRLKSGDHFYTDKPDKDITAAGSVYGVRLITERLIVINHMTLKTERITKVTLL